MPLANLSLTSVVGLVGTLWLVALMLWLHLLLAGLLIGGSLLTSLQLVGSALAVGLLRLPVLFHLSRFGPPAGLIRWKGLPLPSIRAVQDAWDIYREELGLLPPDLVLTLGDEYDKTPKGLLGSGCWWPCWGWGG